MRLLLRLFSSWLTNWSYYWIGLGILFLVKIKHKLRGYTSPKPFPVTAVDKCIDYDERTVKEWLGYLSNYTGASDYLHGRSVLELGPGSDLGNGLILLSEGAEQYVAVDAHDLATRTPTALYSRLLQRLRRKGEIGELEAILEKFIRGEPGRLDYVPREDFDLQAALRDRRIDIVFSQASFEHFEDVDKTTEQLTRACSEGAVVVITIDLQTHSRWIRQRDPTNIYRYPDWLYRWFHFPGIPNRVRPREYEEAFKRNGWVDILRRPLTSLSEEQLRIVQPHLHGRYKDEQSDMSYLTMLLCARRPVSF